MEKIESAYMVLTEKNLGFSKLVGPFEAYRASEVDAMILRYTEDMKYIQGIVERGTGEQLQGDEQIRVAMLEYVKELESENKRLHKYECWFDDIYGMLPGILWDSNKIVWSKEKAFKKLLEICETADQFKAMKKKHDAYRVAVKALVEVTNDLRKRYCKHVGISEDIGEYCGCPSCVAYRAIAAVERLEVE